MLFLNTWVSEKLLLIRLKSRNVQYRNLLELSVFSLRNVGARPTMVNTYLRINVCVGLSCLPPIPQLTNAPTLILRVQAFKMM